MEDGVNGIARSFVGCERRRGIKNDPQSWVRLQWEWVWRWNPELSFGRAEFESLTRHPGGNIQ